MSSTHSGPVLATRDGLTVIDCRACGWAHLDPLPAVPGGYYESEFWQVAKNGWRQRYEQQLDWLSMRHNDWLTLVQEHSDGTAWRQLLDVGSGWGYFLMDARARAWRAIGIEPSVEANQYSTQALLSVHQGTWENFDHPGLPLFKFDCISALWLMEHLPNPFEFLAWCRAHMAPGGALLLCVPNEWNPNQTMANGLGKCKPNFWLHPTHLNYWNPATLSNLLGRAGFRVVDALASYPIERFLLDGCNYTKNEHWGAHAHADVRRNELALPQNERIQQQRNWARQSIGRDLLVIAKANL